MTILIVDDTEANLLVLQVLLERHGYQVVTAADGAEALAKARQHPPDLIVSDILMPVMDGFSLCREWKKDERLKAIPFVFYTSTYTEGRDREFALGLGAQQFLIKPAETKVILRTIREVLQQARHPSAGPAQPTDGAPVRLTVTAPEEEEAVYLKQYNAVLIHKLERKSQQLEQTNRELEQDIAVRQRAEAQVRQSREQLRALLARLQTLREDERTRIAREIHDELGQQLTGLKMDLRWIERHWEDWNDPRANALLDKLVSATGLVDATIKTVQRIATELRPGVLDHLGLAAALRTELDRFQERTGLCCRLTAPADEPTVPREVATTFFRVFQEAMTNVARHAAASEVAVRFESADRGFLLEVRDNGKGISETDLQDPRSLGLLGMQERVRLVGGEVTVARGETGGTVVTVRIPCGEMPLT